MLLPLILQTGFKQFTDELEYWKLMVWHFWFVNFVW
jgi:hypothetical protein